MLNKQHKTVSQQNKEPINLQVLTKYLAYWPFFILFLLMAMGGAYFYLHYTIPKYQANAKLIIKDEKKGTNDSKLIESLEQITDKKIIENETEVLQSRSLMNTVVKKLHLYAPVSQEGKINTISAYQLSPVVVEVLNPDSIKGTTQKKKIILEYNTQKGIVLLNKRYGGPLNKWLKTPYGTLKFMANEKYVPSVEAKPFLVSFFPPASVAAGILTNLKVTASSKTSTVVDLTYRDEVPKRAEDVLNELISSYANAALDEKNTLAKNTLTFIEERLNVVSKDLDSIESRLQKYKADRGAVDIGRQGQLYLENVSANDRKLSDISMQVSALDQLAAYASSPGSMGIIPSTLGVNDPTLTQQMNNLSTLQLKYDQLKGTVAENNPVLTSITSQINQIKPNILNNIQSQRKNLEQSKNTLNATGGMFSGMVSSIPQKEQQLVEITRDLAIKNGIYSNLLQKREDTKLSLASSLADSRVVNYAQSSRAPVTPNKSMIYLIALVVAIGFPVALITGREVLSPKILYRHEIESLTTIPIIGEISYNKSKDTLVVESGKRTVIAEEFRKIRVSLLSLGIDADHKKVLITSSISGEGKSFIAANLAVSISLTGKRVALVDMDLHNPGLGKFFGIKEQPGVSDFLKGKKELKDIIYNIPGNENLFYVSSGELQQDSSELLENGKVQILIAQLESGFDVVIIDSAPIGLITDAYLISSLCDATLYIIMHKISPKVLIRRIDENIVINPIKNPAIIFNGVKTRGFFKSNYGYGYNYIYGYDNKKKHKPLDKKFTSNNSS